MQKSSIISFDDQHLSGHINGQRNIEISIPINEVVDNNTLFKICSWIYSDGNHIDKVLIARNIISLHCKYTKLYDLDEKTYSSIQANYSLYLKENVKDYVELKNKLSELICHLSTDICDQVRSLLTGVKANLVAVLGFMLSVVLINITSSNPLDNIFTQDIKMIFLIIYFGSLAYWLVTYLEAKTKANRIFASYSQLKKNYTDILPDKDIEHLFDESMISDAKKTLYNGFLLYSLIWLILILLILVVILFA